MNSLESVIVIHYSVEMRWTMVSFMSTWIIASCPYHLRHPAPKWFPTSMDPLAGTYGA